MPILNFIHHANTPFFQFPVIGGPLKILKKIHPGRIRIWARMDFHPVQYGYLYPAMSSTHPPSTANPSTPPSTLLSSTPVIHI